MNQSTEKKIESLMHAIDAAPSGLHICRNIATKDQAKFIETLTERIRRKCAEKNEMVLPVNYALVQSKQVAIKAIRSLYEALDQDKSLCSQLPFEYRQKYVGIYQAITQNIKTTTTDSSSKKTGTETEHRTTLSTQGGMSVGIKIANLVLTLSYQTTDAVSNALKKLYSWEEGHEDKIERAPVALDATDATNVLNQLINELHDRQLVFYSERIAGYRKWGAKNIDKKPSKKSGCLASMTNIILAVFLLFVDLLKNIVRFFSLAPRFMGKSHIRVLFFIQSGGVDLESKDIKSQLDVLSANPHGIFIVIPSRNS